VCHRKQQVIRVLVVALALAGALLVPSDATTEELEITYLANEGFLLRAGQTAVLIDALFGEGLRGYGVLGAEDRREVEQGLPPFHGVDLVLASHYHRDHFNKEAVSRFMEANPSAEFLSTEQAVGELLEATPALTSRARGVYPAEGTVQTAIINGIKLRIFNLHHGRGRSEIQNLGLLVELCGLTVLHVGDTEASARDFRIAGLQNLRPDVALLPSWHLRPGQTEGTRKIIRPRQVVAMHLPDSDAPANYFWGGLDSQQKLIDAVQGEFPGSFVPLKAGASISVSCKTP
jgi:L-ascorbate metabolism protein UlaG (beta-lactamase superfamily)